MQVDPTLYSNLENYKLLSNLVMPRPIAWVTSLNQTGVVNLAPFSLFNKVSDDPLYIIISIGLNANGQPKDTARNIQDNGEFVVNMVTEELLDAMNVSAAAFPPDLSELEATGLNTAPCIHIKTPRVAQAQVSLECKLFSAQALGTYTLFIGEVVMFHVADDLIGPGLRVNNFAPIGRLSSPSIYCRTTDRLDRARLSYAQWLSRKK